MADPSNPHQPLNDDPPPEGREEPGTVAQRGQDTGRSGFERKDPGERFGWRERTHRPDGPDRHRGPGGTEGFREPRRSGGGAGRPSRGDGSRDARRGRSAGAGPSWRRPGAGLAEPRTAREIAASVLLGVLAGPVDDAAQAVHQAADRAGLDDNDRRLAFQLTHLVLRHGTYLDSLYYRYFKEAPERLRLESRVILRLAVAQKALLDRIPDHAIGDESVRLAREFFRLREAEVSFLNAIVRRICEHPSYQQDLADLDRPVNRYEDKFVAPLAEAARRSSCPDWIVGLLGDCLGVSAWKELPWIINGEAPVVLRANLLKTTREQLAADLESAGIRTVPGELAPAALVLAQSGDLPALIRTEAFRNGHLYIQDEASQLVGLVARPRAGEAILDLCAAPGGKATHLAELSGGLATITATDVTPRRFEMLMENLRRMQSPGVTARAWRDVVQRGNRQAEKGPGQQGDPNRGKWEERASGSEHPAPGHAQSFDLVLLDAPCSGLGTLRRHPEIRYRLRPDDIQRLSKNQHRLLRLAAEFVRPGGRLVYSTCTVTREENLRVVERFLRSAHEWTVESLPGDLPEEIRRLRSSDGFYRTWPSQLDLDGFEMVVLVRPNRPVPGAGLRQLGSGG